MRFSRSVCLVLLAVTTASTNAKLFRWNNRNGGGDDDGQAAARQQRRRLMETASHNEAWDIDASTGTVRKIVDPEEAKAAQSCDGQMAKSLVLANEALLKTQAERDEARGKLKEAEQQVDTLDRDLKETKTWLTAKVEKMEQQLQMTGNEAQQKLSTVQSEADDRLRNIQQQSDFKVRALETAMEELEATKEQEKAAVAQEKDAVISSLEARLEEERALLSEESEKAAQALQDEMNKKVGALMAEMEDLDASGRKAMESAIAEMKTEMDAALKYATDDREKLEDESQRLADSLRSEIADLKREEFKFEPAYIY